MAIETKNQDRGKWLVNKNFLPLLFLLAVCIFLPDYSSAFPPLASEFYGTVEIEGVPAPPGTVITAMSSTGAKCGSFTVVDAGKYGFMSCMGDDPDTEKNEGPKSGEKVVFLIDGRQAFSSRYAVWSSGSFTEIGISYSENSYGSTKKPVWENAQESLPSVPSAVSKNAGEAENGKLAEQERASPYAGQSLWQITIVMLGSAAISLIVASKRR